MGKRLGRRFGVAIGTSVAIFAWAIVACVGDDPGTGAGSSGADAATSLEDRTAVTTTDAAPSDTLTDGGDAALDASDAALRKCATIVAPPAPNDFFCADFDGVGLEEGWTKQNQPEAGTLTLTQAAYSSAPNALNAVGVTTDAAAPRGSTLEWEKLGATTIREIDVKFDFNRVAPGGIIAPTTGDIELVTLVAGGTGNATITHSLRHTRGKNVTGSGAHTGLYLQSSNIGGAAVSTSDLITTQPTAGSFTTVRILASSNGIVTITFNGVQVFSKTLYSFTESRARVTVGAATRGSTAIAETFRFDNVIAQVNRN
jgi:hypothetical protein